MIAHAPINLMHKIPKFLKLNVLFVLVGMGLVLSLGQGLAVADTPLEEYCKNLKPNAQETSICKDSAVDTKGNLLASDGLLIKTITIISTLTGVIAAIFIIVGGIQIASSRGESDKIKKARERIIFALAGVVVILLSNLIIRLVLSIVNKTNEAVPTP